MIGMQLEQTIVAFGGVDYDGAGMGFGGFWDDLRKYYNTFITV